MKKATWIILSLLTFQFSSIAQHTELVAVIPEMEILDTEDFSINYPADWELDQSGQMGTSFMVFSPISEPTDDFRENVNLINQDITGYNLDLDSYTELSISQIKQLIEGSEILVNERRKSGKYEYQETIYTGTQGIYNLKFMQYYWVINNKAFVLTFTCKEDTFEEYLSIGKTILGSFKIKG